MNTKILLISLAVLTVIVCRNSYAHEVDPGFEKRKTDRVENSKQSDQKTWDDFMNAVNTQETKKDTDNASDEEDKTSR